MEIENKTIEYRLDGIEKTLAELKDVVIENKLQARDITELKDRMKEFISAINAHETRIRAIEEIPTKEKASRWTMITDNFLKFIITISITILLAKIGFTAGGSQ